MRFSKWLFTLAAVFCTVELSAQSQRVIFPELRMKAGEAMQTVEEQTGMTFSYNNEFMDTESAIVFSAKELSLEQAMVQMLTGKYLSFMFRKQYIIIYPDFAEKPAPKVVKSPRTSDKYVLTPANSRDVNPLRRPIVEKEQPKYDTIVHRVLVEPDTTTYHSDYKALRGIARRSNRLPVLAIKTNLLYGAGTLTPNIAMEVGLSDKWSFALSGSYNPWNRIGTLDNNNKLVHFVIRPEIRYWFCERFNGHSLSVGPFYNQFNISGHDIPFVNFEKAYRYEGNAIGMGLNYGYSLPVAPRWNVEFSAGVGVALMNYKRFDCTLCSEELDRREATYFGPTHFAINLVFLIR